MTLERTISRIAITVMVALSGTLASATAAHADRVDVYEYVGTFYAPAPAAVLAPVLSAVEDTAGAAGQRCAAGNYVGGLSVDVYRWSATSSSGADLSASNLRYLWHGLAYSGVYTECATSITSLGQVLDAAPLDLINPVWVDRGTVAGAQVSATDNCIDDQWVKQACTHPADNVTYRDLTETPPYFRGGGQTAVTVQARGGYVSRGTGRTVTLPCMQATWQVTVDPVSGEPSFGQAHGVACP